MPRHGSVSKNSRTYQIYLYLKEHPNQDFAMSELAKTLSIAINCTVFRGLRNSGVILSTDGRTPKGRAKFISVKYVPEEDMTVNPPVRQKVMVANKPGETYHNMRMQDFKADISKAICGYYQTVESGQFSWVTKGGVRVTIEWRPEPSKPPKEGASQSDANLTSHQRSSFEPDVLEESDKMLKNPEWTEHSRPDTADEIAQKMAPMPPLPLDNNEGEEEGESILKPIIDFMRGQDGFHMKPLDNIGDLMTIEEFVRDCEDTIFVDYDGFGYYANTREQSDIMVRPSEIMSGKVDKRWTHVKWYNR